MAASELTVNRITVSNITVPKQQVGLAMEGVWKGDSIVSGILGLGLPGLTASHPGGNWSQRRTWRDSPANAILYNPIVTSISKQVSPIFSLALSRTPGQSFLAFGGIPAGVKTTGEWATTPIVKVRGCVILQAWSDVLPLRREALTSTRTS